MQNGEVLACYQDDNWKNATIYMMSINSMDEGATFTAYEEDY